MTPTPADLDNASAKFLYRLFHDLKAGVRAFQALPEWIADDLPADALTGDVEENLKMLTEQATLFAALIEGARLYMADPVTQPLQVISLREVAKEVWTGEGAIAVSGPDRIAAPPELLRDILSILFDNTVRHGDAASASVTSASSGEGLCLRVHDNGPGVPQQGCARLFEPFQTLRPRDQTGTAGLGLARAQKAVMAAGGSIRFCHDARAEGCTVEVRLPAPVAYIA